MTHKLRLKISIDTLNLELHDHILDYGAGDGYLASVLCGLKHQYITCFEPMKVQYDQMKYLLSDTNDIVLSNTLLELKNKKYDKLFCLEVLEHLPDTHLNIAIDNIYHLLEDNGKALITVPCESGFNGFVKNCIKKIVDRSTTYSYVDLWNIAYHKKKVNRIIEHENEHPYIYEHFGFNNDEFERRLALKQFTIERKFYFPLRYTHLFSSQIFYVVSR
jgi:2-polyprenyl-3-methyl-5-hydroxy-6-metoxy-1,4-benzoquinol methylase